MHCIRKMTKCLRTFSSRGTLSGVDDAQQQDRNTGTKNDSNEPLSDEIPDIPTASTEFSFSTPVQPRRRGAGTDQNDNPFKKYGLTSPPSGPEGKKGRSIEETERKIHQDGFRKYIKKPEKDKARVLAFLYGRRFYSESKKSKRVELVKDILEIRKAMERAVRLLQVDGDKDTTNEHRGDYRDLNSVLEMYFNQPDTVGFSSNKTTKKNLTFFSRHQQQGNCFMVAPCVMISYFQEFNGFVSDAAPIDVTKFIRKVFTDEELYKYLVKDDGGDAPSVLKKLMTPFVKESKVPNLRTFNQHDVGEKSFDLEKHLKEWGPALVTGFEVHKHFCSKKENAEKLGYYQFSGRHHSKGTFIELTKPATRNDDVERTIQEYNDIVPVEQDPQSEGVEVLKSCSTPSPRRVLSYSASDCDENAVSSLNIDDEKLETSASIEDDEGRDTSKSNDQKDGKRAKEETHAMLLIGARRDKKKNLWLLLQNWWNDMELVEVCAKYFSNSKAELVFVNADGEWLDDQKLRTPRPNDWYDVNYSLVADTNNLDRCDQRNGCFEIVVRDRTGLP